MKKLMIAAAIVCATALTQAATCSWGSGDLYLPGNAQGTKGTTLADMQVTGYLWEVTKATYDSYTTSAAIYNAYKAGTLGTATASDTDFFGSIDLAGTTDWGQSEYAYGIVVYEYTDDNENTWYIANKAVSGDVQGTTGINTLDLANYEGGSYLGTPKGSAITAWTGNVPEPTSGLLLLLGMGALALRRKLK